MTTSSSERGVSLGMPELPAPAYPDEVRARLETDAREIIARYPDSRSALLPRRGTSPARACSSARTCSA